MRRTPIVKTGRPLRDQLIAQGICVDCQIRDAEETQRCARCRQRNNRMQRERKLRLSKTAKAIFAKTRIKSYTTLKERGYIK